MPITTVKVIEGVLSDDQKARLIDIINKAMVKVEGEGMRELTWVIIEEVKRGDWAIGGTPISRNRDRPLVAIAIGVGRPTTSLTCGVAAPPPLSRGGIVSARALPSSPS
jgi:4-oxalocrotonate tautomerase